MRQANKPRIRNTIPEALELQSGNAPSWLLSNYQQPSWTVVDTGAKTNPVIVFDVKLPKEGLHESCMSVRCKPS